MNHRVTQVGFIGLGRTGKPMAVNIIRAGFALTVYDSRAESVGELAGLEDRGVFLLRKIWERELRNLAAGRSLK